MGIDASGIQFLCMAKNRGVDFREMLTIGRQNFYNDPRVLKRAARALGLPAEFPGADDEYADRFFRTFLGVEKLESMDATAYEQASIVHDLNQPIPDSLRNRFGVVFDGGSLEHVFHCTQAYKNLMQMVRVGGWFLQLTAANNLLGHGFWQISPELIFRCFTPENGYELDCVLLKELSLDDRWYRVRDPEKLRRRVELSNRSQTNIFTIARKVADVDVFARTPQQSDYIRAWTGQGSTHSGVPKTVLDPYTWRRRLRFLPKPARAWVNNTAKTIGIRPPFDPHCYRRVPEADLLRGRLGD